MFLYTENDARAALGLAPANFFTDALGNAGNPAPTVGNSSPTKTPINWGLWVGVAGVVFTALSYFKKGS